MGFLHRDTLDNGLRRRDRGRFLGFDKVDVQIDLSNRPARFGHVDY